MSAYYHMLTSIIREAFLKEVGKFQVRVQNNRPRAMLLKFSVPAHKGEDGYRSRQLLIYAPLNYVHVYERDTWNVIPEDLLEYDEKSSEDRIKEGHDYTKGASPWVMRACHDSCWTEAIDTFLKTYEPAINGFVGGDWFTVVDASEHTLPEA